ncbi:atp-binding cassette sub-family g member 2-like [Nannochloropsis oceanica]
MGWSLGTEPSSSPPAPCPIPWSSGAVPIASPQVGCATGQSPVTVTTSHNEMVSARGSDNTPADTTRSSSVTPSPSPHPSSPHVGIDMVKLHQTPSRSSNLNEPHLLQQQQQEEQQQQQQQGAKPQTTNIFASSSSASSLSLEDDDDLHPEIRRGEGDENAYAPRSPTLPVRVDLVNLSYKPPTAKSTQPQILQDVNACFEPGQLVAVMGPSGSGKSTLLRLIQGDTRYLRGLKGEALANGTSIKAIHGAWRHLCSLVPQEDVLFGSFTVRETLRFSTQLRLPQEIPSAEKEALVTEVLEDLGIVECEDVLVKDISGGQRRRVSVGLELLVNPSVLLLDEPTSGLDSKTAEDICGLLKLLTKPGRLVMCSIHQPSYKIFSSFSKICFLVKGRLVYSGGFHEVMPYFAAQGFEVPTFDSPADYYMRVMQTEGAALIEAWEKAAPVIEFPTSDAAAAASIEGGPLALVSHNSSGSTNCSVASSMNSNSNKPPPVAWDPAGKWLRSADARDGRRASQVSNWQQYRVLLRRFLEDSYKDKGKMLSGVLMEGTIGLLVGLVWFQQDIHESGSVFPVLGVFIMLTTIAIFDNCVSVGLKFPLTRALHFREFSNGYYRLLPYYFATVTCSLVLASTYQFLQALLVFFLVGLDFTVQKFVVYLFVLALAASMGAFLGFIVGTYTSDLKKTQEVLTPLLMPMLIFSGYMLPLPQIPTYLRFLYFSSFYQYVFSSLAINHFAGLEFRDCSVVNVVCLRNGDQYLALVGLAPEMLGRNLLVCVGFLVGLILLGFYSLRRVSL